MEYLDSIEIDVIDINKCTICGFTIMPEDEIVQYENLNGGIYKVDHFLCAFPHGGEL